jgi:hypothetical protein
MKKNIEKLWMKWVMLHVRNPYVFAEIGGVYGLIDNNIE